VRTQSSSGVEPLVGVDQEHQPGGVGRPRHGAFAVGHVKHLAQCLQRGPRRRVEVAPVETNHARARTRGQPSEDVQQARLADACEAVEVEHQERRFGRL
jgi:hypothetical protein